MTMHQREENELQREVVALLNRYSLENESDTPDFVLAMFLRDSLRAFDTAVRHRTMWYQSAKKGLNDD